MKRVLFTLTVTLLFTTAFSQVAINTDGSQAAASAMLDVQSNTAGLLIPRMTSSRRIAISTPAQGLMVYDTDDSTFYYYKNSSWVKIGHGVSGWYKSGNYVYTLTDSVGIGTSSPQAPLEVHGHISQTGTGESVFIGEGAGKKDDLNNNNNVFIGYWAGHNNTTGFWNIANGHMALYSNTTGSGNTAIGDRALQSNTTGTNNLANGYQALGDNTSGARNIANGYCSLKTNTTGNDNIANGEYSLFANTTGDNNIANGYQALNANTIGDNNIANGYQTLFKSTTASNNIANGWCALHNDTTGSDNIANGYSTLTNNTTGSYNIASGRNALYNNTTGNSNIAIGSQSLFNNTNKSNLVAIGDSALYSNTTGTTNTAIGSRAMRSNSSGWHNSAFGYKSLYANTSGIYNTALGYCALEYNTTGHNNTATGVLSLVSNTGGYYNCAYGVASLFLNTSGNNNVAVGHNALYSNTSGSNNTAIGPNSGNQNQTGNGNIFIGDSAGYNETGSNKLYIDNSSTSSPLIYGEFDNNILKFNGKVGINTTPSDYQLEVSGSTNISKLGGTSYGVYGELNSTVKGDYAIYGNGMHTDGVNGDGYGNYHTLGGVKGYNYWGNAYTFAVSGFSYLDHNRSGGTYGGHGNGTDWGCLAYKNSGGTIYGGYFTSTTTGTGKNSGVKINNGIGAYGELFGANIHGDVYGAFIEGENYALYTNGNVYKNGLDVHLQKDDKGNNEILYTNVSTDATVQTTGYATISNGKGQIVFDKAFTAIVSDKSPIIVTATPTGESKGVYITNVTKEGFTITENENGKSNITVSYIAIGKRKGYENPSLDKEVTSAGYIQKVKQGLHNDNDTHSDGKGLYYENGKLNVGKHLSTLPQPGKPATEDETQY